VVKTLAVGYRNIHSRLTACGESAGCQSPILAKPPRRFELTERGAVSPTLTSLHLAGLGQGTREPRP
jgi:hypothetical protein